MQSLSLTDTMNHYMTYLDTFIPSDWRFPTNFASQTCKNSLYCFGAGVILSGGNLVCGVKYGAFAISYSIVHQVCIKAFQRMGLSCTHHYYFPRALAAVVTGLTFDALHFPVQWMSLLLINVLSSCIYGDNRRTSS